MVQINRREIKVQRVPIIVGNWKMNKTVEEALALVDEIMDDLEVFEGVETVLAPPFVALYPIMELLDDTDIKLAAQNMHAMDSGAYTGEISSLMLREMCDYVILGHSERRKYFHETDEEVNQKVKAALKHDLTPIVAIGESLEERDTGHTDEKIISQLHLGLAGLNPADAASIVVAYEPIWAIGTGLAAT